ncbi:CO/xanthine dehydrogenase FAD-binding subunit [Natranaerovirga hydrolytica]|uniref:CO/xanthine dehydrogenase FAD-binding subunit n=1 Tax=Natranaerovirga hydrolytica TaxID=680378 RepID=A0A4R1MXD3_9FIRM|nr:FAD binding domain-containing protein [Natranaerovirga hydrolytica]TCK97755.1 CO/xanthine dehydrogenase FAD-binding subunit [Natranaerovirga hydrolytica]
MVETYYPKTLSEALTIRNEKKTVLYTGGTDIMVRRKNATGLLPKFESDVLFLGHLKELQRIEVKENTLIIGAGVTYAQLLSHSKVPEVLKKAIKEIASKAIRNIGTLVGNIANASPAGDTLPVLYNYNAWLNIQSKKESQKVPINEWITGPGKTELKDNEMIVSVEMPLEDFNYVYYKKVGARKADAISKLSFVGLANIENNTIKDLRIAFGAVAPTVVRREEVEDVIRSRKLDQVKDLLETIEKLYSNHIKPIDDQRSSAKYRKEVSLRLLNDFLNNFEKQSS